MTDLLVIMVTYGLFGKLSVSKDASRDIIDELMDIKAPYVRNSSLNTSSFDIDDVMMNLGNRNTDYKDALLSSLYAQVEHLKQDSLQKNEILFTQVKLLNQVILQKNDWMKAILDGAISLNEHFLKSSQGNHIVDLEKSNETCIKEPTSGDDITLREDNDIICEDSRVAEIFNNFFSNVVKDLDINYYVDSSEEIGPNGTISNRDPISQAIISIETTLAY